MEKENWKYWYLVHNFYCTLAASASSENTANAALRWKMKKVEHNRIDGVRIHSEWQ